MKLDERIVLWQEEMVMIYDFNSQFYCFVLSQLNMIREYDKDQCNIQYKNIIFRDIAVRTHQSKQTLIIPENIIYIYIFDNMELCDELTVKIIMNTLTRPNYRPLLHRVVTYFTLEDLEMLQQILGSTCPGNAFGQLIKTRYFFQKYLNRVDRSFYYSFYQEKQYIDLQQIHMITLLSNNYSNRFLSFSDQYKHIIEFTQSLFSSMEGKQDLAEEIERIVTDTDIPLPKLKRENEGMFCKTSFQNFLISLKYRQSAYEDGIPCFDELKQYFESKDQSYLANVFMKFKKQQANTKTINPENKRILSARFTPYDICYDNYQKFLIEKCSLHNCLVAIFALTDIWLTSIHTYIQSLEDPFHQFVQIITRYSIYRNYVIQIEQSLSFAFQQYNQLYSEVVDAEKPQYRFWRAAMTKWVVKFEHFHGSCMKVYYYCLNKLRTRNLLDYLTEKEADCPEVYTQIKNQVSFREYEMKINDQVFPIQAENAIQDFFRNNPEQYQVITIQFMEYMIDLSINEETVHWCGHSEQQLSEPFAKLQKYLLDNNQKFLIYLRSCFKNNKDRIMFEKAYFKEQIDFLSSLEVKPMTIRKIVEYYNLELIDLPVLSEDADLIKYDYEANDELLKYFNEKANIKFSLNADELVFYSISPLVSVEELLTKSTNSTNYTVLDREDDEEENEGQSFFEYASESSSLDQLGENTGNQEQPVLASNQCIKGVSCEYKMQKQEQKQYLIQNPYEKDNQTSSDKRQGENLKGFSSKRQS